MESSVANIIIKLGIVAFSFSVFQCMTVKEIEKDFYYYEVIELRVYPVKSLSRHERSSEISDESYHDNIVIKFKSSNRIFQLNLEKNFDLFYDSYYEKLESNLNNSSEMSDSNCHYKGSLLDIENSWAAISTCSGIVSGVIFDGNLTYFLEYENSTYYILSSADVKETNSYRDFEILDPKVKMNRKKRSAHIKKPANSDLHSRFVELLIVVDKYQFSKLKKDKKLTFRRYKELANIINTLYEPLNIYVVLVGIVIWDDFNKITVSSDGGVTLNNFLEYRLKDLIGRYPNDNAQLLTGKKFNNRVVGKAVKNSMCTTRYSGGVNMDHGTIGLVAATVAHEMGHNFGLSHDGKDCKCLADKCIMTSVSGSGAPKLWSSCSKDFLMHSDDVLDFCLHNKPNKIIGPVCGNGFKEHGEECDCGRKKKCACCEPATCKLKKRAKCATGKCCDLKKCKLEHIGHICRPATSECDLPEYCNGASEFCPNDFYLQDGTECQGDKAYCANGHCKTHKDQCNFLWGHKGTGVNYECFSTNTRGDSFGNCGGHYKNNTYLKCSEGDVKCGMMQCTSNNGQLRFKNKVTRHVASVTISIKNRKRITCRSAIIDFGPDNEDPSLVPDGAKCGDGMMCLGQKCIPADSIRFDCPYNCNNAGVCNNVGNCHCDMGYEAPFCDVPGPGGSINSGPASDPTQQLMVIVYVLFLGIIPLIILIVVIVLCRKRLRALKSRIRRNKTKNGLPPRRIRNQLNPVRKPMPFHILPTNSVRDPKTSVSQVKLVNAEKKGSLRAPPPPPPRLNNKRFYHEHIAPLDVSNLNFNCETSPAFKNKATTLTSNRGADSESKASVRNLINKLEDGQDVVVKDIHSNQIATNKIKRPIRKALKPPVKA